MARRQKSLLLLRREALERQAKKQPEVPIDYVKKVRKVKRHRDKHHLHPRSRGGSMSKRNLLYIDRDIHSEWHRVFANRTLDEVIALLQRVKRAKENQDEGRFDRR